MQKGFTYLRRTRKASMVRRAHMAGPYKAMWTRGRMDLDGLAFDGPTGIVGPSKIGGHTGAIRATQHLKPTHLIYLYSSPLFLRAGLCSLSFFAGDVAVWGATDEVASIEAR